MTKTIGFICTGNTCRSPMAEYYFKAVLPCPEKVHVFSAGILAGYGWKVAEEAVRVVSIYNSEISNHISKPLNEDMVEKADMLIVMTESHKEGILKRWPNAEKKIYLLREFDESTFLADLNIFDPVGCPMEIYEKCFSIMKPALDHLGEIVCKEYQ